MYVTPPDTDVYAIPKVLAPMPQKVNFFFFFGEANDIYTLNLMSF